MTVQLLLMHICLFVICYRLLTDVFVTILLSPLVAVADKLNADAGRSLRRAVVNRMFYSATPARSRDRQTSARPLPTRCISTRRRGARVAVFRREITGTCSRACTGHWPRGKRPLRCLQ